MSTDGYGGRHIRESVRVQTNDPDRPWLGVTITGVVERFAEIKPERVRLAGPAGQLLSATVEIVPRKEFPFKILQIKARSGDTIKYELTQRCTDGNDRCILRVENTLKEKGRYIDVLTIHTDSKLRPTIPIYVTGMIE